MSTRQDYIITYQINKHGDLWKAQIQIEQQTPTDPPISMAVTKTFDSFPHHIDSLCDVLIKEADAGYTILDEGDSITLYSEEYGVVDHGG